MSNLSSIARPYALATFEIARTRQQLPTWKAFLESAAYVAKQASVAKLLANPEASSSHLFELFEEVLTPVLDREKRNFLLLVAQNKRLYALPEISELFNAYYAALEKISRVRVVTAVQSQQDFQQKLSKTLSKRFQHEVTLQYEVDPSLLGGAVIHIGDRVIDGSIRGKLTRLLEFSLR